MKKAAQGSKRSTAAAKQMTLLGTALRSLGGLGGSAVGSVFGAPVVGSQVGSSLGAAISKWLGSGDYSVGSNTIVKSSLKAASSIPMMHNNGQSVTVRHREYLGEIRSAETYTVRDSFELNPGNSRTFPWLSSIAVNFQEYSFKGIVFHYVPTSGTAVSGSSPSLGSVMLQTSYRVTDSAPASKVEMLNEYCSNEVVPSEPMAHPIECDPKENPFNVMYVRSGDVPPGDAKLMYDLGVTHVAVTGQLPPGNNVLGDLWVTYEVELKKPIVHSNVTAPYKSGSALVTTIGGPAAIFTGTTQFTGNLSLGLSGNTVTLPKGSQGKWLFVLRFTASVSAWTMAAPTLTNCTLTRYAAGGTTFVTQGLSGTAPSLTSPIVVFAIMVTDPSVVPQIVYSAPTITGTLINSQLIVSPIIDDY